MKKHTLSKSQYGLSVEQAETYLKTIFPRVSRTFSITIPQLPSPLRRVVMNAYLLARILDTIEDDNALTMEQKFYYGKRFIWILYNDIESAKEFALEVTPQLSNQTNKAERDLLYNLPLVLKIIQTFNTRQREAIQRCVKIMWEGMQNFLERRSEGGLETLDDVNNYCYHAAGVVGELLTDLFSDYSNKIAQNRNEMQKLAISFGRGLQISNILYDHWEDRKDGICWLPRSLYGNELYHLKPENYNENYRKSQTEMVNIAYKNLQEALKYTLLIPASEAGIRRFLFWTISFSLFALRGIQKNPSFSQKEEIKVPRTNIVKVMMVTRILGTGDATLTKFFNSVSETIPDLIIE
ncbi:farnesyl-diphosphate farnesyltransferase [Chryseobacterium vietnamense]|uniref:Farnesyl-diphosphate farnesyltransferase n=1 Tax=Chryseobacterium vietnamense TaxID=866785 RepID=A0ACC6JBR0_9FLAO|nr:squalene/phytoene synthase family protein [Chryseobacterium vietnamense]MDR6460505.1 farnesyl-diphosphate farnesyltransferase [Chryseobacterium vietnamense]